MASSYDEYNMETSSENVSMPGFIKLISSDGHEFILSKNAAVISSTINAMLSCPGYVESESNVVNFRDIPSRSITFLWVDSKIRVSENLQRYVRATFYTKCYGKSDPGSGANTNPLDMGFLWKLSKFTLRVGLVAGAVKLSIDNDIWSLNTVKGSDLYDKLKKYILPGTIVYKEKLPSVEDVEVEVKGGWNNGVNKVFNAVENAPSSLNTVANRLINNK